MTLLLRELDAFVQEHCRCGDLDGGVEGERVWMACTCWAMLVRAVPMSPDTPKAASPY